MFNESFTFYHSVSKVENRLPLPCQHHNKKVTLLTDLKKILWLAERHINYLLERACPSKLITAEGKGKSHQFRKGSKAAPCASVALPAPFRTAHAAVQKQQKTRLGNSQPVGQDKTRAICNPLRCPSRQVSRSGEATSEWPAWN